MGEGFEKGVGRSLEWREERPRNFLLQAPENVSSSEKIELADLSSSFDLDNRRYTYGVREGRPFFTVIFRGELPSDFTEEEQDSFIWKPAEIEGHNKSFYILRYGNAPEVKLEREEWMDLDPEHHIAWRREEDESVEVDKLNAADLAEYLEDKKAVFYTGAGLSRENVPAMKEMCGELGIDGDSDIDDFARLAVREPGKLLARMKVVRDKMSGSQPTRGHKALAEVAKKLQCQILTENIDLLHERSGVRPVHVSKEEINARVQPWMLRQVDAVITVGLSADDRGLLALYKHYNPKGRIIAINTQRPEYLGKGDALVEGDAQEVLVELEKSISTWHVEMGSGQEFGLAQ